MDEFDSAPPDRSSVKKNFFADVRKYARGAMAEDLKALKKGPVADEVPAEEMPVEGDGAAGLDLELPEGDVAPELAEGGATEEVSEMNLDDIDPAILKQLLGE